jgi:acyl-CoA synthetase (AMP-forming)/AMP-acid ligase II
MAVSLLLHPIPPEPRPAIKPRIDARLGRRDFAAMQDGIPWSSDLLTLARRFGPRIAITDGDARITYAALSARAHGLARRLMAEGFEPGQPVATFVPNGCDAPWVSYGLTMAGVAETPCNTGSTDAELRWFAELTGFKRIIAPQASFARLAGLGFAPLPLEDITPDDSFAPLPPVPSDAWGRIIFTSGTTGKPKAILHSHGGRYLANILQRAVLPFTPQPGERVLLMTPFTHGAALIAYAWLDHGGEVVLQDGVRADRIAPVLAAPLSAIFAPPTVLAKLLALFPGQAVPGLKVIFCGTQTLTRELYARAAAQFGPVVRVTYGMSECFNPITVLEGPDVAAAMAEDMAEDDDGLGANLGWPATGVEIAIRDEVGSPLPSGESGDIWLRARHMNIGMIGPDGLVPRPAGAWHRTGDLGALDARGRLRLAGRASDVMKSGGYRVHPAEIEMVLEEAGQGRAICVLGLASDYWGEVIIAVADGLASGWEAAALPLVEQLARHKRPRAWLTLPELPRNAQGKVVRARVREAVLARWRLEDGPHPRLVPAAAGKDE